MVGFKFLEAQAGTDTAGPIPTDLRVKKIGHAHALELALVVLVETFENEAPDMFEAISRFGGIGGLENDAVTRSRCRIQAVLAATGW